jgi:hypothetical protein
LKCGLQIVVAATEERAASFLERAKARVGARIGSTQVFRDERAWVFCNLGDKHLHGILGGVLDRAMVLRQHDLHSRLQLLQDKPLTQGRQLGARGESFRSLGGECVQLNVGTIGKLRVQCGEH